MRGWIAVVVLGALAATAHAGDVKPSDVLDFDVETRAHDFVVRDGAYEMTFVYEPQLEPEDVPLGPDHTATGAGLVDSADSADADAGGGAVFVTILPIPADVPFDGAKGVKGTADGVIGTLGEVSTRSERAFTFGGLKGREIKATGTRARTSWRMRMVVAWDAPHRTLVSITAVFGPTAPADAPAHLDAFIKAFKVKPGAAPHVRAAP